MSSLQGRLGIGLLVGLVLVFLVQWVVVSMAITRVTEAYAADRLAHDAESLLAALRVDSDGTARLASGRVSHVYHQPFSGHYFAAYIDGEVLRSRSLWDQELGVPRLEAGEERRLYQTGPLDQRLLVVVRGYEKQGRAVTVAVAEDMSAVDHSVARFQLGYAALSILVLVALVLVQRWVVRRSLLPLQRARGQLVQLSHGERERLDETLPREVQPFVQELNHLLDVLRARLGRSRNALGNLAHAVKNPLTVLARLEQDPAVQAQPDVREQIQRQTDTIRRLMDRELKRARLAGQATPGSRFAVQRELADLIAALQQIYREKDLNIDWEAPLDLEFPADREDMLELFGNLLDNACKWAAHRVRITVEGGPGLRFRVEDDGPGCPAEVLPRLTRRGLRVDETPEGQGLGLAIVGDIVRQYSGTLRFDRSANLGGLCVEVNLADRPQGTG